MAKWDCTSSGEDTLEHRVQSQSLSSIKVCCEKMEKEIAKGEDMDVKDCADEELQRSRDIIKRKL